MAPCMCASSFRREVECVAEPFPSCVAGVQQCASPSCAAGLTAAHHAAATLHSHVSGTSGAFGPTSMDTCTHAAPAPCQSIRGSTKSRDGGVTGRQRGPAAYLAHIHGWHGGRGRRSWAGAGWAAWRVVATCCCDCEALLAATYARALFNHARWCRLRAGFGARGRRVVRTVGSSTVCAGVRATGRAWRRQQRACGGARGAACAPVVWLAWRLQVHDASGRRCGRWVQGQAVPASHRARQVRARLWCVSWHQPVCWLAQRGANTCSL